MGSTSHERILLFGDCLRAGDLEGSASSDAVIREASAYPGPYVQQRDPDLTMCLWILLNPRSLASTTGVRTGWRRADAAT